MDNERNTPLHKIVMYHKPISDFTTLHSIIVTLTDAGAHTDSVNSKGETPLDSAGTGMLTFDFNFRFTFFVNFKV